MSSGPAKTSLPPDSLQESASNPRPATVESGKTRGVIAFSSFFFALLQSICSFFAALNGLRLGIGISSLVVSASVKSVVVSFHVDWLRVPMIVLALAGSLLNLIVLAQIRRLRRRPAAQWRIQPVSPAQLRSERIQFVLSIATLILIGIEEYFHYVWHGHF